MSFRLKPMLLPLVFIRYSVSQTHVIEKYVLLALCLQNLCYYPLVFVCYSVFKAYVIK